jgi:predicted site-specific integrase-resolvase
MSTKIQGKIYYRTSEACHKIGISRATLFRWLKAGILERNCKDRRGWRIFSEEDLALILSKSEKIEVEYTSTSDKPPKPPVKEG